MSTNIIEQPVIPGGVSPKVYELSRTAYRRGSPAARGVLGKLRFDPIVKLVSKYEELEQDLKRQKEIRDGVRVELSASGKPRSYNPETLTAIYDKQIMIAKELLRYKYGRVPETEDNVQNAMPLIVNLTKKGEQYVVNEEVVVQDEEQGDEE